MYLELQVHLVFSGQQLWILIDEYYGFAFLKKIPIAEDDLDKLHTNFEIISVVFNICFYHIDQMVTVST